MIFESEPENLVLSTPTAVDSVRCQQVSASGISHKDAEQQPLWSSVLLLSLSNVESSLSISSNGGYCAPLRQLVSERVERQASAREIAFNSCA